MCVKYINAIRLHRPTRRVYIEEREIHLTIDECRLLTAFGTMEGKIVETDRLLDFVFDHPVRIEADRSALSAKIYHLRKKLGGDFIQTIRGSGFRFTEQIEFTE